MPTSFFPTDWNGNTLVDAASAVLHEPILAVPLVSLIGLSLAVFVWEKLRDSFSDAD